MQMSQDLIDPNASLSWYLEKTMVIDAKARQPRTSCFDLFQYEVKVPKLYGHPTAL